MSWFSILPSYLTTVETWIIRFFLILAMLSIGPWLLLLAYDMVLYIIRAIYFEIPYIGGRAKGKRRPAKPSLEARPDGRRRTFSFAGQEVAEEHELRVPRGASPDGSGVGVRRRVGREGFVPDNPDGEGADVAVDD